MGADLVLGPARRLAESLMQTTCVITRADTSPTLNEDTLLYEGTPTTVYEGPCRVRFVQARVSQVDVESQVLADQNAVLSLPISTSTGVETNDLVLITASATDAGQVGAKYRIQGVFQQTHSTARRFSIEVRS